jgi:hypothetical protein
MEGRGTTIGDQNLVNLSYATMFNKGMRKIPSFGLQLPISGDLSFQIPLWIELWLNHIHRKRFTKGDITSGGRIGGLEGNIPMI